MGQIMRRFVAFLFFGCTVALGFQESQPPRISRLERDVYAIYSQMLANPLTDNPLDNNARYLIADRSDPPFPPEECITAPKEREKAFREVLSDYERRKGKPRKLKPLFTIQKPYLLLNPEEVEAFEATPLATSERRVRDERFRGVTHLFTLSDVYFDNSHALALSAISSWCGNQCGLFQWKVFEKVGTDGWVERPWAMGCFAIADARWPFLAASV
jgi:hypothetical protein